MTDFTHLHVHSEYSLLDGYATTKAIAQRAADLGMDSIALTDHGVMYGAMEFYDAAKKAGVKPIIGMEAYMAPGSAKAPMVKGGKNYYHLLLLAQNETGYRNLVKLTTRAHLDGLANRGVFARPRIDRDLLEQHSEGLVVTSTCIAGEVIQHLTQRQKDKARESAAWHRDLLGADNYYLELQLHDNTPELVEINDELVKIGKELGIPLVATNDTHFVRAEDQEAQSMVMAMGFNLTHQELCSKNYQMDGTYHIATGDEMWQRFKQYGTAPIENTRRIADMCNLKLDFGRVQLPEFEIPEGHDAASYLRFVCEEGLMRRFNSAPTDEYVQRLDYELDVINQTGFPDYMLIVWDYVKYARSRGIPCVPRGSAGASLVLYTLGITDVDPITNKLLFERFLSPERLEMPDIDTDFADSRRGEILDYISSKYGRDNVAQIITYSTLGAKAALRDMGRVLDIPLGEVDRVAKLIPTLPVGTTIASALDRVPELKQIYDTSSELRNLITWAQKVEGRMKSIGTHACGVVVSHNPLVNLVPLQRTTKDENAMMAAYEGPTLAKIGLLKMDILGLTNLSVVAEALNYIEQTRGERMELADIPLEDRKTFESLGRGETTNVFQLESTGMTRYLMQLKPTRVDDLYAMVALYRPGPLEQIPVYVQNKNNPRAIHYLHPILKPILEDTYGVIVYQEQIMQLLQTVADYTLGEAYIVIKAISKKDRALMAENEVRFKDGCVRKGIGKDIASALWELILPFAGYSFNRPHSTLYGLLSYQTAWLKNNYPTEYMAAVLSAATGDMESVTKSVNECGRLGVAVLPVDLNRSSIGFTIEPLPDGELTGYENRTGIRFGLSAIRNVGEGPLHVILKERAEHGPFRSLEGLCERVDRAALNKRVLESLIKCGAMDTLPGMRRQQLAIMEQALSMGIESQRAREAGQATMFDMLGGGASTPGTATQSIALPDIAEEPHHYKEQLGWEKELMGMYVSAHPMVKALEGIDMSNITSLGTISDELVGQTCTFLGMISSTRRLATKKGDSMLVATFEDQDLLTIELVVFPKSYEKYRELLVDDALLRIKAKVDRGKRDDTIQLLLESAEPLEEVAKVKVSMAAPPAPPLAMDLDQLADAPEPAAAPPASYEQTRPTMTINEPPAPTSDAPPAAPAAPVAPPPGQPLSAIRSRTKVNTNGNGHGNGNGNGHSTGNGGGYEPPQHTLRLYLARTADYDADVRLMQRVHDVLCESEGEDAVLIHIPNGNATVVLQPNQAVRCHEGLLGALRDVLGAESVVME